MAVLLSTEQQSKITHKTTSQRVKTSTFVYCIQEIMLEPDGWSAKEVKFPRQQGDKERTDWIFGEKTQQLWIVIYIICNISMNQ